MMIYVAAIDGEVVAAYSNLAIAEERVKKALADEGAKLIRSLSDAGKYILFGNNLDRPLAVIYEVEVDCD